MTRLKNLVLLLLALSILGCAAKKEESSAEAEDQKVWQEMDDYHMLMAETFHPYKDSANLEPAKAKANELSKAADKWVNSDLPEKVNNDEMKDKLAKLKEESVSLVEKVNAGNDTEIGEQLNKVHDLFHEIQEHWYGGGEHHHPHH